MVHARVSCVCPPRLDVDLYRVHCAGKSCAEEVEKGKMIEMIASENRVHVCARLSTEEELTKVVRVGEMCALSA